MGNAALEGLQGISRVEKGFRGFRETNTVTFDPSKVTVKEMVRALERAGTYLGTAE